MATLVSESPGSERWRMGENKYAAQNFHTQLERWAAAEWQNQRRCSLAANSRQQPQRRAGQPDGRAALLGPDQANSRVMTIETSENWRAPILDSGEPARQPDDSLWAKVMTHPLAVEQMEPISLRPPLATLAWPATTLHMRPAMRPLRPRLAGLPGRLAEPSLRLTRSRKPVGPPATLDSRL